MARFRLTQKVEFALIQDDYQWNLMKNIHKKCSKFPNAAPKVDFEPQNSETYRSLTSKVSYARIHTDTKSRIQTNSG